MNSPLLRVLAAGKADLVKETLDFRSRLDPKFVTTLKGQGDATQRAGIMVPVLISGTFAEPKFRPDLKGLLQQQLPQAGDLQKMLEGSTDEPAKAAPDVKESVKGILKGLPF